MVQFSLISALSFRISFSVLALSLGYSCFSRTVGSLGCLGLLCFCRHLQLLYSMSSSLWYWYYHFILQSVLFLPWFFSVPHCLVKNVLFSLHAFVYFLCFLLQFISNSQSYGWAINMVQFQFFDFRLIYCLAGNLFCRKVYVLLIRMYFAAAG